MRFIALFTLLFLGTAAAQDYPTRPVRIIAAAQGGLTELMPRTLAAELHKKTGQPWLVESKLGAGGVIGAEYVMKSPPDGYTLFVGFTGIFSVLPALGAKLPFEVNKTSSRSC